MRIVLILILFYLPAIIFSKDDKETFNEAIELQIAKAKIEECRKQLYQERTEAFNIRVKLELEKIRHTRDVKLLQIKADKLTDRVYNFAFLTFIGFSFGLYAFRKRRDE